jgi:hypothetical protein
MNTQAYIGPSTTPQDHDAGRLADAAPCGQWAADLAALDPDRLTGPGLLDAYEAWNKLICWAEGHLLDLTARLATHPHATTDQLACLPLELATRARISENRAHGLLHTATTARTLPGLVQAMTTTGQISGLHARALADAVTDADLSLTARTIVAGKALRRAHIQNLSEFRRSITRYVLKVDPQAAEHRRQTAKAAREVMVYPLPDGMAALRAQLAAEDAEEVRSTLHSHAETTRRNDPQHTRRTAGQARADALVDLVRRGAHAAATGTGPIAPPGAHVNITVPLDVLLGQSTEPATLHGHGTITAQHARDLAFTAGSTWRRLVTDPTTGTVLDVGRTVYQPPAAITRHVHATMPTCLFPGCIRKAEACDLDHRDPYGSGGVTSAANLGPLCRRHHNAKTHFGWQWTIEPTTRTITWTSPTGRTHIKHLTDAA